MPLVQPTATRRPVGDLPRGARLRSRRGKLTRHVTDLPPHLPRPPLHRHDWPRSRESWRELESDSGASLQRLTGGIHHGRGPQYLADLLKDQKVSHQLLSAADAAARWPGMTLCGPVLFHPDAGVINADASIAAMLDVARQNGAHLAAHTPWGASCGSWRRARIAATC
ncbi:FAD-dependent oxidoreductase [Streptomyces sp. NPDC127172]|uniref:FAD-dependent oxidoreductase n=1 Tax=Streptomyces sp. NPDC127172 TaxID=3345382 RepID=UPI003643E220